MRTQINWKKIYSGSNQEVTEVSYILRTLMMHRPMFIFLSDEWKWLYCLYQFVDQSADLELKHPDCSAIFFGSSIFGSRLARSTANIILFVHLASSRTISKFRVLRKSATTTSTTCTMFVCMCRRLPGHWTMLPKNYESATTSPYGEEMTWILAGCWLNDESLPK